MLVDEIRKQKLPLKDHIVRSCYQVAQHGGSVLEFRFCGAVCSDMIEELEEEGFEIEVLEDEDFTAPQYGQGWKLIRVEF